MLRALVLLLYLLTPSCALAAEPIFEAAAKGDVASLEKLLAAGTPIDSRDRDEATPLIAAALSNQPEAAKLLISKGADVMARNVGGFTPLHAAAFAGSAEVAALLLDHKADIADTANKAGAAPLMVAAEMNHPAVVELLISRGADVSQPESHGYPPISRAQWKGHNDMVRLLKRHGAVCDKTGQLPGDYEKCLEIKE